MSNADTNNVDADIDNINDEYSDLENKIQVSLAVLKQLNEHSEDADFVFSINPISGKTTQHNKIDLSGFHLTEEPDWWGTYQVLKKNNLLNKTGYYKFVISDKGKKFFAEEDQEKKNKLATWWKEYMDFLKQISTITSEKYIEAIQKWVTVQSHTGLRAIRVSRNAKRILATLYFNKNEKFDDNVALGKAVGCSPNLAGGAIEDHLGTIIKKNVGMKDSRFSSGTTPIMRDGQLVPNLRAALDAFNGQPGFDLKEWNKFEIKKPKHSIQDEEEEDEDDTSPEDEFTNEHLKKIHEILIRKKQVILYGPPGTGKTYMANEYVGGYCLTEEDQKKYARRCTFHPEYGYEHFIEGFQPEASKDGNQMIFKLADGVFKKLCEEAKNDIESDSDYYNHNYYLIIDEINRGDISRIFGELITLIEKDKRDEKYAITLPLSGDNFWVPPNVYIIATMNTADRSIALLDTALRRRFGFYHMKPDSDVLIPEEGESYLVPKSGLELHVWFDKLNDTLKKALKNRHDAEHILIGHSYFMPDGGLDDETFKQIILEDIIPLLEEYFYENKKGGFADMNKFLKDTTGIYDDSKEGKGPNADSVEV